MSAADQRAVVAVLRTPLPLSSDRWMPAQVARMAGLSAKAGGDAIRALRNAGKIKFGALELSPSMLVDEQRSPAKAGGEVVTEEAVAVEPVSRAAGRPASRRKVAEGRGCPPQRESGLIAGQAIAHDTGSTVGGPVKPPSPIQETATEPCAHPGDQQGEVAAAGESSPLPDVPGHVDPAVRDTADEAGAPVVRAGVPASSLPAQPGNPLGVELLGEIEAYLAHTRMSGTMLGELALTHPGYVNLLRKRGTARDKTAVPMRTFMACWPDGATRDQVAAWRHDRAAFAAGAMGMRSVATAPGDAGAGWTTPSEVRQSELAEEVKAEALSAGERRHVARKFGGGVGNPLSTNLVAVQAVLLAEPEDAFLFLRRKWPKLLREVIAQARASGTTPAAQLAHVIESGLIAAAGSL